MNATPEAADRIAQLEAEVAELRRELDNCSHEAEEVLLVENAALKAAVQGKDPVADKLWPMLRVWGEECQVRKAALREVRADNTCLTAALAQAREALGIPQPDGLHSECIVFDRRCKPHGNYYDGCARRFRLYAAELFDALNAVLSDSAGQQTRDTTITALEAEVARPSNEPTIAVNAPRGCDCSVCASKPRNWGRAVRRSLLPKEKP